MSHSLLFVYVFECRDLGSAGVREASAKPIVDGYTQRMTAACREIVQVSCGPDEGVCVCGASFLGDIIDLQCGVPVHPLAVHFLAYHRDAVPQGDLDRIMGFEVVPCEPDDDELVHPPKR